MNPTTLLVFCKIRFFYLPICEKQGTPGQGRPTCPENCSGKHEWWVGTLQGELC